MDVKALQKPQLVRGDALKLLKKCKDGAFDAVVTDFPYGINMDYGSYKDTKENLKRLIDSLMPELLRVAARVAIFCGNGNAHLYPVPTWTLCWYIPGGLGYSSWGFPCWQPVLVYGKDPYLTNGQGRRPDAFESNASSGDSIHPCPKPLAVMKWIVERVSLPGEHVLDPLMGRGTTGQACVLTGRSFTGFEQDKSFFDEARREMDKVLVQSVNSMLFQGGAGHVPALALEFPK